MLLRLKLTGDFWPAWTQPSLFLEVSVFTLLSGTVLGSGLHCGKSQAGTCFGFGPSISAFLNTVFQKNSRSLELLPFSFFLRACISEYHQSQGCGRLLLTEKVVSLSPRSFPSYTQLEFPPFISEGTQINPASLISSEPGES